MFRYILRYGLAALIVIISTGWSPVARADDDVNDHLIEAAFIYNFTKFVEWPDGKAIGGQSNIDICVLKSWGDNFIRDTADNFKVASTAKLALSLVEEKNWRSAPQHCHILFISDSEEEEGKIDEIVSGLKGQPILTVSNIDGFAEKGGIIGFVITKGEKPKLVINVKAAAAAGLRIDAQLLEIALKVL